VIIMAAKKKVEDVGEKEKKAVKEATPKKAKKPKAKKAEPKAAAPLKEPKAEKKKKAEPVAEPQVEEKPVEAEVKPAEEAKEEAKEEVKEEAPEKPEKPFTMAKPRPLPRPVEKSSLELDPETRRLLGARKTNKASLPEFHRLDAHKKKKLKLSWRKPKGHHSQLRRQRKAKGSLVKVGFGSPAAVRGLHASGYEEVLVHRPEDVRGITKTQAIRIGGTVGRKKQVEIEKAAKELNIKVLNPLNVFEEV
jgi:large subunit ribosomal protein L32e